ncbi:magnesium transporter [Lacimicrobium alkaliphilum]|uniref:Magnesium transporter MgtE n=1 Tax=Lacimicrobium alkaliphilum TaxID=1526571 RepID=A0ABQ1RI28_9ALTE|nr:magnesium transporter [Lacimicrobium alkaliphilum]GGD71165.1 magnesium transporter MgtE [Lacimicrobium alkaliphilum]
MQSLDHLDDTAAQLNHVFMADYPSRSARYLEMMPANQAAGLLQQQPMHLVAGLWKHLPPGCSDGCFEHFDDDFAARLIAFLDSHLAISLLSRLSSARQDKLFTLLEANNSALVKEYRTLLSYPEDCAARMMTTNVQAFSADTTVADALARLRRSKEACPNTLFLLDPSQQLTGQVQLTELVTSSSATLLSNIAMPVKVTLSVLDHKDTVVETFEGQHTQTIPVLDAQGLLVGQIGYSDVYQSTKEDLATDMQTMVGVSKEEKALSSSWFAVTRRMPWLQINLLTAFAAAAVVGMFENLIAEVTALAILLPVAAGQSGNAGAQALAVTMRGLTLREITTRQWSRVLFKEMRAGFLNGVIIAVTCATAVYFWSQSVGLALVMGLAMVSSLVIACSAGALVPMGLKRLGMDPAQSSSIVLTTITDIAGFMSFLGIALLLTDLLPKG